jgi:hypothetical protein
VVVLTDGHFPDPARRLATSLRDQGVQLHLGVVGGGPLHDRQSWVTTSTRLPVL